MYSNLLVITRGYAEDKPQLMVDALLGLVKEAGCPMTHARSSAEMKAMIIYNAFTYTI